MNNNIKLEIDHNPKDDSTCILKEGILRFNESHTHERANHFCVFARNANLEIVGGASIYQHSDALYLDTLWVDESYRGKMIGTELMETTLKEAVGRGCKRVFTDTFDFQALDFYEKFGFKEISRVEGYLLGHDRIFCRKDL